MGMGERRSGDSVRYSVHPIPLNKQDVEEVLLLVGVVATSEPERRAR